MTIIVLAASAVGLVVAIWAAWKTKQYADQAEASAQVAIAARKRSKAARERIMAMSLAKSSPRRPSQGGGSK